MALTKVSTGMLSADAASVDLNIDAGTMFIDASANRVGIGNTSPATALDVTGSVTADNSSSAESTILTLANSYTTDATGDATEIMFQHYRSYSPSVTDSAFIKATKTQAWDATGDRTSKLEFGTRNGATEPETRMTIMPDGNVGIGTSSPAEPLHVQEGSSGITQRAGTIALIEGSGNTKVTVASGATSTGELLFGRSGDNDAGRIIYDHNDNSLAFSTNSSERMRITSAGSVGIGTSSPSSSAGWGTLLEVSGTTNAGIKLTETDTANGDFSLGVTAGTFRIWDETATAFRLTLDGSGNFGIGQTTPIAALDVTGTDAVGTLTSLADTVTRAATIIRGSTHANGYGLYMGYGNSSTDAQYIQATLKTGSQAYPLLLNPYGGNVGIGETSPSTPLHVNSGTGNIPATFQSTDAGSYINIRDNGSGTFGAMIGAVSDDIVFSPNNVERMRLDASGNFLVGTTATASSNNDGFTVETYNGGVVINVGHNGSAANGDGYVFFRRNGTALGSITQVSSTGVAYNTSSDQRLKENIADADDAGSKVDAIQVRKFDWIADGSHQKYGMIAQELQTVAPEAVSAPEDPEEMMGVDYSKLVPMMLKEIQSLRARVAQLES